MTLLTRQSFLTGKSEEVITVSDDDLVMLHYRVFLYVGRALQHIPENMGLW